MICSKHPEWAQTTNRCPDCLWERAGTCDHRAHGDEREAMLSKALAVAIASVPKGVGDLVRRAVQTQNLWSAIAIARKWLVAKKGKTYAD